MLARRLRSSDLTAKPISLNLGADLYTTIPVKIVKLFCKKLEALYSASLTFDRNKEEELFSSVMLPSIPTSLQDSMEAAVTSEEVASIVKTLKSHKRLGPHGFPAGFYKKFSE